MVIHFINQKIHEYYSIYKVYISILNQIHITFTFLKFVIGCCLQLFYFPVFNLFDGFALYKEFFLYYGIKFAFNG